MAITFIFRIKDENAAALVIAAESMIQFMNDNYPNKVDPDYLDLLQNIKEGRKVLVETLANNGRPMV